MRILGVVGDDLDTSTAAAVRSARAVAADPAAITDEQFENELRLLFDEEEIVELVAFICLVAIAGQMFGAVVGLEGDVSRGGGRVTRPFSPGRP